MENYITSAQPGDHLELETHVDAAAALARALWLASQAEGLFVHLEDAMAFRELAGLLEEHTAHARGIYTRMTLERDDDELEGIGADLTPTAGNA
jgi:hypothetical protein